MILVWLLSHIVLHCEPLLQSVSFGVIVYVLLPSVSFGVIVYVLLPSVSFGAIVYVLLPSVSFGAIVYVLLPSVSFGAIVYVQLPSVSFGAIVYVQHEKLSKNMFDHLVDEKATLELSKNEREFIKRLIQPSPTDCCSLVRTPCVDLLTCSACTPLPFIMLLAIKHTHFNPAVYVFPCIPLHLLSSCTF